MRPCPVCINKEAIKHLDLNYALFDDLQLSGEMQLVECAKCHSFYNTTELSERDFAEYYRLNEHYLAANSAGSGGYSSKDANRYARIYELVQDFQTSTSPRILDFGCGKGGMLHWLQEHTGAQLVGIEASATCREFVSNAYALPVFNSLDELSKKADIVVLSHIVEHLFSPMNFIRELNRITHAETIFYIEVPRAEAYFSTEVDWHELYFEHINHFTETGLINLLQAAGLQILKRGITNFYENDPNTPECQYVVVKKGEVDAFMEKQEVIFPARNVLPAHTVIPEVLESGKDVSIWGISQYTQLVMGMYPQLIDKIRYLFDGSSAKIGRMIKGVEVLPSSKIPMMAVDELLLLPKSPYLDDMINFLEQKHFLGRIIQF